MARMPEDLIREAVREAKIEVTVSDEARALVGELTDLVKRMERVARKLEGAVILRPDP